jgi:hypothetical protein
MQTSKGMSIFWLGLLGFILFPLGILSIILGLIRIKKKASTVWTNVGLALGLVSTICAILIFSFFVFMDTAFAPPHKAVPLVSAISTSEIQPPFKTPEQLVTGYNQLVQSINEKGFGSSVFQISGYFQAKGMQDAQGDLEEYNNLYKVIKNKLGSKISEEFIKNLYGSDIAYTRPTTLAKKSDQSYSAIDTDGNDVHIVNTKDGWKRDIGEDSFIPLQTFIPKPGMINSITKQVQDGSLTSSDAIWSALIKASDN